MASSASPTPAASTATLTLFDKYLAFVKAHEIIIVEIVAGLMIWGTTSGILKRWDAYEAQKVVSTRTVVVADTAKNDALSAQISDMKKTFNANLAKLEAKTNAQTKAIADASAPVVASQLGGTATDANNISLPLPSARTDAVELVQGPVLQTEVTDETQIDTKDQALISGLQTQLGDQTKACAAQVAELKVASKRSWLHGFKWGIIIGAIGGVVLGSKL